MFRIHLLGVPLTARARRNWIQATLTSETAYARAYLGPDADVVRVAKHAVMVRIEAAIERITNKSLGLLHFIAIMTALSTISLGAKDVTLVEPATASNALLILMVAAALLLLNLLLAWPKRLDNVRDIDAEVWDLLRLARGRGVRLTIANVLAFSALCVLVIGLPQSVLHSSLFRDLYLIGKWLTGSITAAADLIGDWLRNKGK